MPSAHGQDQFAIEQLGYKHNGTFLDIGCAHPIDSNNTYRLEKEYNFRGVSIDRDNWIVDWHRERYGSMFIQADALTLDYPAMFRHTDRIDYLSIDIDPGEQSLAVLKMLPPTTRFSVITFEFENPVSEIKNESKRHLLELGYQLVVENVSIVYNGLDCPFEDWYIDPTVISYE
mgnify:CR=1 FL=1